MSAGPEAEDEGALEVAKVLEDWLASLDRGIRPDAEEIAARHPHVAAELREAMAALNVLHGGHGRWEEAEAQASPQSAPGEAAAVVLGDYRILREVGRGGMGVVYEAVQASLGRRVALKVMPFAATLEPRLAARFQREAEAAGSLQHPHIVPIYSIGRHAGVPYYAMPFIEGESVAHALHALRQGRDGEPAGPGRTAARSPLSSHGAPRTPGYFRTVARLGLEAAEGLQHAHDMGVIHRDVKPGNLLVDGAGCLWITDFGLAALQTGGSVTRSGDLLGTVRYMAPEQARRQPADGRSDVYSLGATLYEMLTLEPAVAGQDPATVLRGVLTADPVAPRRRNPAVPVDLESVVLKAMAPEPSGRYATARELAEDLGRFLDDRPVRAHRVGVAQRAGRWLRGHRALVGSAVLVLILTAGALAVGLAREAAERARTTRALRGTQAARSEADAALVRARIDGLLNASELAAGSDPVLALILAREAVRLSHDASTMAALRSALAGAHERLRIVGHGQGVVAAGFLPGGSGILTASLDSTVRVWDAQGRPRASVRCYASWIAMAPGGREFLAGGSGHVPATLYTMEGQPATAFGTLRNLTRSGAFSPDGTRVFTGMEDGTVQVWDVRGVHVGTLGAGGGPIDRIAVSPDGRHILAASTSSATATLLDLMEGALPRSLSCGSDGVQAASFSPTGAHALTATLGGEMTVWGVDGTRVASFRAPGDAFLTGSFSPDGRHVVAGTRSGSVWMWEPIANVHTVLHGHEAPVSAAVFSRRGDRLVTCAADRTARLWDLRGRVLAVLRGHDDAVTSATFSEDGAHVLTASRDGTARVWDLEPSDPVRLAAAPVSAAAFHPSGQRIGLAFRHGPRAVVVDPTGREIAALEGHAGGVLCLAYSADGRRLCTGSADDTARTWDEGGRALAVLGGHSGDVLDVSFSRHADRLLTRDSGLVARLWVADADPPRPVAQVAEATDAAFEPAGGHVIVACRGSELRRLGYGGSCETVHTDFDRQIVTLRWSPDGRWFATLPFQHAPWATVWRAPGAPLSRLRGHGAPITCLAFSPDGNQLLTGSGDRTARIWDLEGHEMAAFRHMGPVRDVGFLGPSGRLLSVSADGSVHIWTADGRGVDVLPHSGVSLARALVSPAGDRVLTLANDEAPLLWRLDAEEVLRLAEARILRDLTPAERIRYRDLLGPSNEVMCRANEYVDRRFEELLVAADVREATRTDPTLPEQVREAALALVAARVDDPIAWNLRAWSLVRPWGLPPDVYALALPYVHAACRLRPDDVQVLNTLGIARLRLGQYAEAVALLERCDRLNSSSDLGPVLEDVGGLALGYEALGRTEEARRSLARFRELLRTPRYAHDRMRQDWAEGLESDFRRRALGAGAPAPADRQAPAPSRWADGVPR